jgi:4-hydroxy-2-oxoheptanedioate aldolase
MTDLKHRLHNTDDRMTMHIVTIPSATVTQAMAAAGADSVIIDMEHGAVDHASAHAMIAATKGTSCAALVRVAENDPAQVKRVLDLGAEGIVFPMIRTAEDARRAVASLRYPPRGNRGFGPFIAQSQWDATLPTYADIAEDKLVCCLLVETRDSVENIDEICAVDGIDLLVPAVFDLSTDLGVMGQLDHPVLLAAMARIEAAARAAGLPLGNVALTRAQAEGLFDRGYRVVAGFDLLWLREKTAEAQAWTRG